MLAKGFVVIAGDPAATVSSSKTPTDNQIQTPPRAQEHGLADRLLKVSLRGSSEEKNMKQTKEKNSTRRRSSTTTVSAGTRIRRQRVRHNLPAVSGSDTRRAPVSVVPADVTTAHKQTNIPSRVCAPETPARRNVEVKPNVLWPQNRRVIPGSSREESLVQHYLPLVRTVVSRLAMNLPPHVDSEELYSAGLTGLLNAVRNYNPKAGTAFETYARLRIRGAVFDELRKMDWVPRSVHTKARKLQAATQALEQHKGRAPTDEEMARHLKVSVKDYQRWVEEARPITFVCLDAAFNNDYDDSSSQHDSLADPRQEDPVDGTFRRELARLLADRMKLLPTMQRKVLALYYFEDMRLREIAEAFGLTESRICQIHAQAITAIRGHLQEYDSYFESKNCEANQ